LSSGDAAIGDAARPSTTAEVIERQRNAGVLFCSLELIGRVFIAWELRTFAAVMPRFGIAIGAI